MYVTSFQVAFKIILCLMGFEKLLDISVSMVSKYSCNLENSTEHLCIFYKICPFLTSIDVLFCLEIISFRYIYHKYQEMSSR